MLSQQEIIHQLTRREVLQNTGAGLGSIALSWLMSKDAEAAPQASHSLALGKPHFAPRAKRVIFMHMIGAPSQLDLWDDKPVLRKHDGKPCPKELLQGKRFAFLRGHPKLLGSKYRFRQHGQSGLAFSELLPHLGKVADEIAIIKSLRTEHFNHAPAQLFFQTGFPRFGRPTVGAWTSYGLGTENENLPSFVVLITGAVGGAGNSMWGSGFLPTVHQGVEFRSKGDPVLFLANPKGIKPADRRRFIDTVNRLNRKQLETVGDPEIATRIDQYEMAYKMQTSVPDLMDISGEPQHIHRMYGTQPGKSSFANNCLLARRLVERGVRFVQLFDQGWDHHGGIFSALPNKARQFDRPCAALIKDLRQRGLLDDTLVVWGSEFGRTPMLQSDRAKPGRDHHKESFCFWFAGGGVKGGTSIGKSDELGYYPVEDPLEVHDVHASILHLLGIHHKKLTYRFQGRDYRLTDIKGKVISKLMS